MKLAVILGVCAVMLYSVAAVAQQGQGAQSFLEKNPKAWELEAKAVAADLKLSPELTTKLVDAQFPPWEMVVPRAGDESIRISVEAAALVTALTRVARATRGHSAKFRVNGAIVVSSWSEDAGEAEITVPALASTHHGDDDLVIGLDTRYLHEALAGVATTAELRFGGVLDPVRVDSPGERCAVLMPLRV